MIGYPYKSDHSHNNYASNIAGFTLIELMISLVLGLLISAAVMQVYLINARTITVQQSASEVQDSTIFALQALEDHVRLANLGNPITSITDSTINGGIVLTNTNLRFSGNIPSAYFTVSAGQSVIGSGAWTGKSNTDIASDQLTIQYKNITPNDMYDCEGATIDAGSSDLVIERYFVRLASGASDTPAVKDLVLACDAVRLKADNTFTDINDSEVLVAAIDQFKVLLGVQTEESKLTYIPSKTYLELTDKPPITTVKLGFIIRSTTPLLTDADAIKFNVLGTNQNLKGKEDTTRTKYYRRSYESTVLLRNARVMSVVATAASIKPTTP